LFPRTYTCVVYFFFSGKSASMVGTSPTQFYERIKKSQCDVDVSEGSSSNPPPKRQSKRIVHRNFPRDRMHIDTEIEEVEEDRIETSDDESADDETNKMSPMQAFENSDEEDEDNGSEERHESVAEEEEEGMVEETLNP
jgi:hypothetical protein